MKSSKPLEVKTDNQKGNGEQTRERIVREALQLFCQKGYEGASVREIVQAAGVTKPVLYYYFKNKDDLFSHIIHSSLDPFYENILEVCNHADKNYIRALETIVEHYLEAARLHPNHVRFLHAMAFSGLYNHVFDFISYWNKHIEIYIELFQKGREQGIFRSDLSPYIMARGFMGLCQMAMRSIVYCPDQNIQPPTSAEIVDIFLKGIMK